MVVDGNAAGSFSEEPVLRAFETDLIGPIPGSATEILRSVTFIAQNTLSVLKDISSVTCQTLSSIIVSLTKIANSHTDSIVEDPSGRALRTSVVLLVPNSASRISWSNLFSQGAFSTGEQVVSEVTAQTSTIKIVPSLAVIVHLSANSVSEVSSA